MSTIKSVSKNSIMLKNEDLKEYMRILLDLEKNIRIQNKTIDRLNYNISMLGIPREIEIPKKEDTETETVASSLGLIAGIITAIVVFFIKMNWKAFLFEWIWSFICSAFWALLWGIGAVIIFGIISAILVFPFLKHKVNKQYQYNMSLYYSELQRDKDRVQSEETEKSFITDEINILKQKRNGTKELLAQMYSYGFLHKDYHNIVAVATIYGYLEKGKCRTLEFDSSTGDQGAYNIYDREAMLNEIITNEKIIIKKIDELKETQQYIYWSIMDIQESVNRISDNVTKNSQTLAQTQSYLIQLRDTTEAELYSQQQTESELRYMNFMNDINRRYK